MPRVVVEPLPLKDVIQHHQTSQIGQRLVAQERRQPHQCTGVAAAVFGETRQVVGRAEVHVVERKVEHHAPGTAAPAQSIISHLARVLIQQFDFAPSPAPVECVGGEQVAVVRDAQLLEQRFANYLAAIARVVIGLGRSQDGLDVDASHLDGDDGVLVLGDLDLADLAGPVAALAQHILRLAARHGRAEGAVVQCRQTRAGQALE